MPSSLRFGILLRESMGDRMMQRLGVALLVLSGAVVVIGATVSRSKSVFEKSGNGSGAAVVVELFTSEGCSSCPPADKLLKELEEQQGVQGAQVIALEEHVDYWDHLGWRDPFSSREWTERQQDYAARLGNGGIYTPQMVVDGTSEFVGNWEGQARAEIAAAARKWKAEVKILDRGPIGAGAQQIHTSMGKIAGAGGDAEIWLAVTERGLHSSVKAGENAGEELYHAGVVRSLKKIGKVRADRESAFESDETIKIGGNWKRENLQVVVFAQEQKTGRIIGAAIMRLAK